MHTTHMHVHMTHMRMHVHTHVHTHPRTHMHTHAHVHGLCSCAYQALVVGNSTSKGRCHGCILADSMVCGFGRCDARVAASTLDLSP